MNGELFQTDLPFKDFVVEFRTICHSLCNGQFNLIETIMHTTTGLASCETDFFKKKKSQRTENNPQTIILFSKNDVKF